MTDTTMIDVPFDSHDQVRVAVLGVGSRGRSLLGNLLGIDAAVVTVVSDPDESAATAAQDQVVAAGGRRPAAVATAEQAVERDDVDLVVVAGPWEVHTPQALAAMNAGKHVAVEVPFSLSMEDCWELVNTSERTRRHCVMLENCNYGRNELLVLNLVRAGVLGELLHAEASYTHDLRRMLLTSHAWRRHTHITHDGNLYPTHGLGPVAAYFDINRGDRFVSLASMSSGHRGLELWRDAHPDSIDPTAVDEAYRCGDINTSLISTARGRTIVLQHQVIGPRPYTRRNEVVGTAGIFTDYPPRIFVEDPADPDQPEEYVGLERYAEFEHRLWSEEGERARAAGGHGGMDFLMMLQLITAVQQGRVPDADVYDGAALSAPAALSFASVAAGGSAVEFPDFTGGRWEQARPGMP